MTARPREEVAHQGAVVIDGGGRTLMPGLIDAHWHVTLVRPTPAAAIADDPSYRNARSRLRTYSTSISVFLPIAGTPGPAVVSDRVEGRNAGGDHDAEDGAQGCRSGGSARAGGDGGAPEAGEGVRQVERLSRASGEAVQAIGETRQRLLGTMEIYNSIMADDAENRRRLFNNLQREMEGTEHRRARNDERVARMDAEADALFKEWAASAAAIANVVDGNPLVDINLVADPARSLLVVMKDGRVHKNLLASAAK